jgi:hypothetical protein
MAFPNLTTLDLIHVHLGDGRLFSTLAAQGTCPLTSLALDHCVILDTGVEVAATALARLPSLKACRVSEGVTLRITSQLTALTHLEGVLEEAGVPPPDTQLLTAVCRNTGLQSLTIMGLTSVKLPAGMLQRLLSSCTSLTQLDLTSQWVNDEGLDTLLQHGTNITDLRLGF